MNKEQVDILIIGAGPSGSVAASVVERSGLSVKVLEKKHFPRFAIGESLLPRCMEHFEAAGFLDVLKARNYQYKPGAIFIRDGQVCHFDFSEQFTEGWTWTWLAPRADFDKVLTDELERRGVDIAFGTTVTNVTFEAEGAMVSWENDEQQTGEIEARFVIDASGYGRVLPRLLNLEKPTGMVPRSAYYTHLTDPRRPQGPEGTMATFYITRKDMWIWVIPFSDKITSVGFTGNIDFIKNASGSPESIFREALAVEPTLQERFGDQEIILPPHLMENYAAATKQLYGPGYVLTGNSAEFLDPVFSSGVTFATESGLLAAQVACRQLKGEDVNWEKDYARHIRQGVDTFRSYVEAWYEGSLQDVFFSDEVIKQKNMEVKKQICSVLAGYVWDESNPYVRRHDSAVYSLAKLIRMRQTA